VKTDGGGRGVDEGEGVTGGVELREPVPEGVCVTVLEGEPVPVGVAVPVELGEGVPVDESEPVGVAVPVALGEGVPVELGEGVPVELGEGVLVMLLVTVELLEPESVAVPVRLFVPVTVADAVLVAVMLPVPVTVEDAEPVALLFETSTIPVAAPAGTIGDEASTTLLPRSQQTKPPVRPLMIQMIPPSETESTCVRAASGTTDMEAASPQHVSVPLKEMAQAWQLMAASETVVPCTLAGGARKSNAVPTPHPPGTLQHTTV
jgi:hypothetical protein